MRKVFVVMFMAVTLLMASAYSVYAEMPGLACHAEGRMHGQMGERGHRMWMLFKGLDLSEQQRSEIRDIRMAMMKETIRKRADIQIARMELKELLQKDNVDMGAVGGELKQIASLQTELRLVRIKAMQEIKSKLTPEQRTKLKENFRKHMMWRQEGHHGCMCSKEKMGYYHEKEKNHEDEEKQ